MSIYTKMDLKATLLHTFLSYLYAIYNTFPLDSCFFLFMFPLLPPKEPCFMFIEYRAFFFLGNCYSSIL